MRYFSLLFFIFSISYADSIIDFGKQETKTYKPYQANKTDYNKVNHTIESSVQTPTKVAQVATANTTHKTQAIAHSNTPTHKGNHLKGQEFFNYYIKGKPKGIVRDFYIWQYLNENKLNAAQILSLIHI